jgi:hypothetical protein
MVVSDVSLASSMWSAVRSALVASSIATSIGTDVVVASINAQYSDKSSVRPQIVVLPISSDETDYRFGGGSLRTINVVIECYSDKSLGVDKLADGVRNALSADTIAGVSLVGFSEDYAFNSPGDNKFHLKTLVARYERE